MENVYNSWLFKYSELEASSLFMGYIINTNAKNQQYPPVSSSRHFNSIQRKREVFSFPKVCVKKTLIVLTALWDMSVLTDKGIVFKLTCLTWLYFPQIRIIWLMIWWLEFNSVEEFQAWLKCACKSRSLQAFFWAGMQVAASSQNQAENILFILMLWLCNFFLIGSPEGTAFHDLPAEI